MGDLLGLDQAVDERFPLGLKFFEGRHGAGVHQPLHRYAPIFYAYRTFYLDAVLRPAFDGRYSAATIRLNTKNP